MMKPYFLAVIVSLAPALSGQQPQLVKDIDPFTLGAGSNPVTGWSPYLRPKVPNRFREAGNRWLFVADDGRHGPELWATDGTPLGTQLVKDIAPGPRTSNPDLLTSCGGKVFFTARNAALGNELWVSDGTTAGTYAIDILPGAEGSGPWELTCVGSKVFFTASDRNNDMEVWVSDGSAAGTRPVVDLNPGGSSYPRSLCPDATGRHLLFTADDGSHGRELWRTDGSAAGTVAVRDFRTGKRGMWAEVLANHRGKTMLLAPGGLYATDWTTAGTTLLKDIEGFEAPLCSAAIGNDLLFLVHRGKDHGLWKTDGTAAGTVRVLANGPGIPFKDSGMIAFGKHVFYASATFATGLELWRTDGTATGTGLVKDLVPGTGHSYPGAFAVCHNRLYFQTAVDRISTVWVSDGTPSGTVSVRSFDPGPYLGWTSEGGDFTALPSNTVLFRATDRDHGSELFTTDGTSPGTVLLKDVDPGRLGRGTVGGLIPMGSEVVFSASDGSGRHGREPWVSDGSAPGTEMLADVTPGATGSDIRDWRVLGDRVFINANSVLTVIERRSKTVTRIELVPGLAASDPAGFAPFRGKMYFAARTPQTGVELFVSDGTKSGTRLVADIVPGAGHGSPSDLCEFRGALYFAAGPQGNRELWRFDGKTVRLVKDLNSLRGSAPAYLTRVGEKLFFAADLTPAPWTPPMFPQERKRTNVVCYDGTTFTALLADDPPEDTEPDPTPANSRFGGRYGGSFTNDGTRIYFRARTAAHGAELFVSDGTVSGTRVLDIEPGSRGSEPTQIFRVGETVLCNAYRSGMGIELMAIRGRTVTPIELEPGPWNSGPFAAIPAGSRIAYLLRSAWGMIEVWRTDGTVAGTNKIHETPGMATSDAVVAGGTLFFSAGSKAHGLELFKIDLGASALPATSSCSRGPNHPRLSVADPVLGQISTLTASGGPTGAKVTALLLVGLRARNNRLVGECETNVDLDQPFRPLLVGATPNGRFTAYWQIPNSRALVGLRFALQAAFGPSGNGGTPFGVDLTNGVDAVLGGR